MMNKSMLPAFGFKFISEDLILEIIFRLPPVHLLRFKSICKKWYVLISDPKFLRLHSIQFHLKQRINNIIDCLILRPNTYYPFVLPQDEEQEQDKTFDQVLTKRVLQFGLSTFLESEGLSMDEDIMVVDSCNGLLLYRKFGTGNSIDYTYYVCNPIMKQYVKIPVIDFEEMHGGDFVFSYTPHLAFDPSLSCTFRVFKCCKYGNPEIELHDLYCYNSERGSWKLLSSFDYDAHFDFKCVLVDGFLYWSTYGDYSFCIDVEREKLLWMDFPETPLLGINARRKCLYFGECAGQLRLIQKFFDGSRRDQGYLSFPCQFDIMEMDLDEDHVNWSVKYSVNIEGGYEHIVGVLRRDTVVNILYHYEAGSKGEELLFNVNGRLVTFNLTSNTFGPTEGSNYHYGDFKYAFPYTSTCFPLS